MKKKLVWIGIVLLLGVMISTGVNAVVEYGFNISGRGDANYIYYYYCRGWVDDTYTDSSNPSAFKQEFLDALNAHAFAEYGGSKIILSTNNNIGATCLLSNAEKNEKMGLFAFGYLYTLDDLTSTEYFLSAYSPKAENWNTRAHFEFYDISSYDSTKSFNEYLRYSASPVSICGKNENQVDDDYGRDVAGNNGATTATFSCSPLNLHPGLYFVAIGLVGTLPGGTIYNNYVTLTSKLSITRFNGEPQSYYDVPTNHITYDPLNPNIINGLSLYSPRYIITTSRLTSAELNTIFKDYVENTSGLCKAAGGQTLSDFKGDFSFEKFINNGYDIRRYCCGDDDYSGSPSMDDGFSFNYEGQTYFCSDGSWDESQNAQTCTDLVNANAEAGKNVYEDILNKDHLQYFDIESRVLNGSDGCCGDDFPVVPGYGDYGYVASVDGIRQYFCYDEYNDIINPKFNWFNAATDKYHIRTIYKNNTRFSGNVDVISNSQEWYYCNANGKNLLNDGIPIPQYGTFSNFYLNINEIPCTTIATTIYGAKNDIIYTVCTDTYGNDREKWINCCEQGHTAPISNPTECDTYCYDSAKHTIDYYKGNLCMPFGIGCSQGTASSTSTSNEEDRVMDKTSCPTDPNARSCVSMEGFSPETDRSCLAQSFKTAICSASQLCGNGTSIQTTPPENCCAGEHVYCKNIPSSLNTIKDCDLEFGQVYSTEQYNCPSSAAIGNTGSSSRCCFGPKTPKPAFLQLLRASSAYNSSFICFRQNDQDVISNCCWDDGCKNAGLAYGGKISNADNKVQSLGGVFHTIENFDILTGDGKIVDNVKLFTIPESTHVKNVVFTSGYKLNLSQFSYLEFDIEFSTEMEVSVNNYNFGSLSKYLNNGDKPERRHHAVIPIPKDINGKSLCRESIDTLTFRVSTTPAKFLIDNIVLTPEGTDLQHNSINYYCTGGFEGWIDDLDPPKPWTVNKELSDWTKFGKYALTCDSQSAFGWTGTMCCGDDTKRNYGEFYNDTAHGCFNGSLIKNDWSLGFAMNYEEGIGVKDRLDEYKYSGLLYYQNHFIGCQIPNHDVGILVSKDGKASGAFLVSDFKSSQCDVVGSYYCTNGIWRQNMQAGEQLYLKKVPSGAELIKNGFKTG